MKITGVRLCIGPALILFTPFVASLMWPSRTAGSDFWDEVRTPGLRAWRLHIEAAESAATAERWADTHAAAEAAIALLPERAGAYAWLGRAHAETSNLEEAVAAYRRALELDPTSLDTYAQGSYAAELCAGASAHELSARILRRLLGRMPDNRARADLYALYGDVLLTLGPDRLREAVLAFREAARQGGRANVRVSLGLALALARSGETLESTDLARDA
ncbi:MAG: tetratricopeptide repeat protein, partial [Myxococcota bacterium]